MIDKIETSKKNTKGTQASTEVYFKMLYDDNELDSLDAKLGVYGIDNKYVDLSFINIKDKLYKISEEDYKDKYYTLYEYCILTQRYDFIKQYCQQTLKSNSIYSKDSYFDYCKTGNLEAIYFCFKEGLIA